jgi:ABC-2 type transport system ATP-binding protein
MNRGLNKTDNYWASVAGCLPSRNKFVIFYSAHFVTFLYLVVYYTNKGLLNLGLRPEYNGEGAKMKHMRIDAAISAEGLAKSFGKIKALAGVDLKVHSGTVMALLGPNGAGKTTVVRILATLMRPDAGHAKVAGYDVVREAASVRRMIGLTGQYTAVDENLTGRENLEMVGRLYHLSNAEVHSRPSELLELFELTEAAERRVKTYSGGMRRRLDLALSLVARPPILFLDEPTTGLDPRGRLGLWEIITKLVKEGITVLLTTQYLEEADRLADTIALLDKGRIIKEGTSQQLKDCCGGDVIVQLRLADYAQTALAVELLNEFSDGKTQFVAETDQITLPITGGSALLPEIVRRLDSRQITIADLALRQPTLDDVFLALTGHSAEESA